MPELPEVEVSLRGIAPHVLQQTINAVEIRHTQLRWPIIRGVERKLIGGTVRTLQRRAKYLLLHINDGGLIIHLGMSGRLRILTEALPAQRHDHVDIHFANGKSLRFTDPRRFGAFIWSDTDPLLHHLLAHLGKEPLERSCNGAYLWAKARGKKMAVKTFIMDQKVIVGVGNIYANEALFMANIHPEQAAGEISVGRYNVLAHAIKTVLRGAIRRGGTTLRDFLDSDGKPGYFIQHLAVYGRQGLPCVRCGETLAALRISQRSTVFCRYCQVSCVD